MYVRVRVHVCTCTCTYVYVYVYVHVYMHVYVYVLISSPFAISNKKATLITEYNGKEDNIYLKETFLRVINLYIRNIYI